MRWKKIIYAYFIKQKNVFFFVFVLLCFFLTGLSISFLIQSSSQTFEQKNISKVHKNTSHFVSVRNPAYTVFPTNPGMIPAGTQMMIPPWVLQQYHLSPQKDLYGNPLNFLIYNYGSSAPSINNKDEDDIYIPLSRYKPKDYYKSYGEKDYYYRRRNNTVMAPVTHLTTQSGTSAEETSASTPAPAPPPAPAPVAPPPAPAPAPAPPPPPEKAEATAEEETAEEETQTDVSGPVLTVNEDISLEDTPPVPPLIEYEIPDKAPTTCAEPSNALSNTEASAPCVNCTHTEIPILEKISNEVNRWARQENFSSIISVICNKCDNVDIKDLVGYIEARSKEENVPPEIMFAIMLKETTGDCNARGDRDKRSGVYKSFGLFQLNITNSTRLRVCNSGELTSQTATTQKQVCHKGSYRNKREYTSVDLEKEELLSSRPYIGKGICLNNPYCNFEEALHLLKGEKWHIGNSIKNHRAGRRVAKPQQKSWPEMSANERNLWRNAVIAYNGDHYHSPVKTKLMEDRVGSSNFDNWELKRIYFVRQYLNNGRNKGLIGNLAYMERITGREVSGGLSKSSICQWIDFRKNNQLLSCSR